MVLSVEPYDVTPDGEFRSLVRVSFRDATNAPTTLLHGGDVEFAASRGGVQWQTRFRFGAAAALVATTDVDPVIVTARLVDLPRLAPVRIATPALPGAPPRVVVRALGPHLVVAGWFPRVTTGAVRIARHGSDGSAQLVVVAPPASTYRDATVRPGRTYTYAIRLPGASAVVATHGPAFFSTHGATIFSTRVPFEPPHGTVTALAGKGMWFSFSPEPNDPDAAQRLDPQAVVERAARAGIRCIVLRTAYGPFWEITPAAQPTVDALIDAAAARGIAVIGWTIPRSVDFDDLSRSVATTAYRTANGNGFAALAIDLERGDGYLGNGDAGRAAIVEFVHRLREALGPVYPLVATVEDPSLEHLSERDYPYAEIAPLVDALQPMTYWRMLGAGTTTPQGVRAALKRSFAITRELAGHPRPLVAGGQTSAVGTRGAPSPAEVTAAIDAAHEFGALGITFFDWTGTSDAQWDAIAAGRWP